MSWGRGESRYTLLEAGSLEGGVGWAGPSYVLKSCLNLFICSIRTNLFLSYSMFPLYAMQDIFGLVWFCKGFFAYQYKSCVKIFSWSALAGGGGYIFFLQGPNPLLVALEVPSVVFGSSYKEESPNLGEIEKSEAFAAVVYIMDHQFVFPVFALKNLCGTADSSCLILTHRAYLHHRFKQV